MPSGKLKKNNEELNYLKRTKFGLKGMSNCSILATLNDVNKNKSEVKKNNVFEGLNELKVWESHSLSPVQHLN